MKNRRKSPNLPQNEGAPHYLRVLSQNEGAPPLFEGAPPLFKSALHNQPALFHLSKPSPSYLRATSADHPPPTYPSTPSDMKSSIAALWPRDGLLTTSQAVTMNPRSQWSLFEFGKRLNCEEICIQKFSCCSGERGHSVLASLMG